MSVFKSLIIAISTYSKIPMPYFEWKEKDMRYAICFFPVVGAVIGAVQYFWLWICESFEFNDIIRAAWCIVINIIITGGIHIDGFMDTMDALHSYRPKEKKLEILKDAHIGAFAVIMFMVYILIYLGAVSEMDFASCRVFAVSFIMSRIYSGISVVCFKNAKSDGMLYSFSSAAHKRAVRCILVAELFVLTITGVYFLGVSSAIMAALMFGIFIYYRYKSYKEFGGITGDIAGWFLCISEMAAAVFCVL